MSDFDAVLEEATTDAMKGPILPSISTEIPIAEVAAEDSNQFSSASLLLTTKNDKSKNEKFIDEIREWVKRSTVRDSSKRSSSSKKKKGSSSKKKAGKDSKSKPKDADPAKDFSEKDADPTKDLSDDDENLTADGESRSVLSPDIDEIIKQKEHRITIDSSLSQSNEHFCDINLRDVRMRELSISQDSESQSAADRILAVKNSLKKIAIIDPYDTSTTHKEVEEHDAHEEDEQETITAAELALMESLPFSYRTYDELVRLNREKSYAGLLQRKLEAYLTDEDFQIVFRKNRDAFYAQPLWKQKAQKKNVKLF